MSDSMKFILDLANQLDFILRKPSHASHCRLCLRGLPGSLAEADTSRMPIAFYCLGAMDLMNLLHKKTSEKDRDNWREWIWAQQITRASGTGFRPSTYMAFVGDNSDESEGGSNHDAPYLISTYTALLSLSILRDDFSKLDRKGLLKLLRNSQQEDGSFSATPGWGESDIRLVYTAFAISNMLDDWSAIDVEKTIAYIKRCRTYEGGYGQAPHNEAQGGPTYCALASLNLLPKQHALSVTLSPTEYKQTLRWLISNQFPEGGFRGRTEKVADACYSFWCGGALKVIGAGDMVDSFSNALFIYQCQSNAGGIAKAPDEPSDPYHTYLSLAAISMYAPELNDKSWELATLDPMLNATEETAKWAREEIRGVE